MLVHTRVLRSCTAAGALLANRGRIRECGRRGSMLGYATNAHGRGRCPPRASSPAVSPRGAAAIRSKQREGARPHLARRGRSAFGPAKPAAGSSTASATTRQRAEEATIAATPRCIFRLPLRAADWMRLESVGLGFLFGLSGRQNGMEIPVHFKHRSQNLYYLFKKIYNICHFVFTWQEWDFRVVYVSEWSSRLGFFLCFLYDSASTRATFFAQGSSRFL